jgi:hypothetical protein
MKIDKYLVLGGSSENFGAMKEAFPVSPKENIQHISAQEISYFYLYTRWLIPSAQVGPSGNSSSSLVPLVSDVPP